MLGLETEPHAAAGMSKAVTENCHRLLMIFLVCCGIPFNVLDSPHFAASVQQLRPTYTLPGTAQLRAIVRHMNIMELDLEPVYEC
jgi:hypothetical protein